MFEKVHAQYGLIGLIIAASLGLASAHGQTTGSAIAVDPSGSEYTGGTEHRSPKPVRGG